MAFWRDYLDCLTNQLLVDCAHSVGPLLLGNKSVQKENAGRKSRA